jgi:hypothetical protein
MREVDNLVFGSGFFEVIPADLRGWVTPELLARWSRECAAGQQWSGAPDKDCGENTLDDKTAAIVYCHAAGARSIEEISRQIALSPLLLSLWGEPPESRRLRVFRAHHETILARALAALYQRALRTRAARRIRLACHQRFNPREIEAILFREALRRGRMG